MENIQTRGCARSEPVVASLSPALVSSLFWTSSVAASTRWRPRRPQPQCARRSPARRRAASAAPPAARLRRRRAPHGPHACRPLVHSSRASVSPRSDDVTVSATAQRSRCAVTHPRARSLRLHAPRCTQAQVASGTVDDDEACELVRGTDLVIGQGDDESVRAYLLEAVKNNNGTCVLFLPDVFGFEDSATRDFAYRIACHGYNVLVPDLFRGNPWKKSLPMDGFQAWLAEQFPERVSGDIETCRKWLVDDFLAAAPSKKLGVVGFCYGGGRLVETLARDADSCFSAGVCFYGSRMDASLGVQIAAPVLFVCGDGDPLCPVETVRELERRARGAKAAVYAGRGHGFAHRPESLEDDGDAEDAFAKMKSWLHDHLLA